MLKQGDQAPAFELPSDSGKTVRLADFKGRKLVVYFYPKDDTPGCTREAIAFTEALAKITEAGAAVVGISKDSVASHCKFRDKYSLAFPLLSDPDLAVHKSFGAFGDKVMYGKKVTGTIRSTFVIDESGVLSKVFPAVKVDGHADAVLAALGSGVEGAAKKAAPSKKAAAAPAKKAEAAKAEAAPAKKVEAATPAPKAASAPAKKAAATPAKKASAKKAAAPAADKRTLH